jgi:hypothetical protein
MSHSQNETHRQPTEITRLLPISCGTDVAIFSCKARCAVKWHSYRWLAIFLCFVIFAKHEVSFAENSSAPIATTAQSLTDEDKKNLASLGRILEPNEAPTWFALLKPYVDRLTHAQLQILNDDPDKFLKSQNRYDYVERINKNSSELSLIDSPDQNAFVIGKISEKNNLQNQVFITTGLLQAFMGQHLKSQESSDFEMGLVEIIGVLAHEIAHPVETLSANSKSKWPIIQRIFSQPTELKTDSNAQKILRAAKLPEDAVIRAVDRLQDLAPYRESASGFSAAVSTHPNLVGRIVFNHLLVTGVRFNQGLETVQNLSSDFHVLFESLARERDNVFSFKRAEVPKSLPEPAQLKDVIAEVRKYFLEKDEYEDREDDLVLKNHFYILLHKRLAEIPLGQLPVAPELLIDLYVDLLKRKPSTLQIETGPPWNLSIYRDGSGRSHVAPDFMRRHSHNFQFWGEKAAIFEDDSFLSRLKNRLIEASEASVTSNTPEFVDVLSTILPRRAVGRMFQNEIVDYLAKEEPLQVAAMFKMLDLKSQEAIGARYFTEVFNKLDAVWKYRHLFSFARDTHWLQVFNLPFPMTSDMQKFKTPDEIKRISITNRQEIRQTRSQKISLRESNANRSVLVDTLWSNRALIALSEISPRGHSARFDWRWLFEQKSIGPREGYEEVRNSLIELLQSESFYKIVKYADVPIEWSIGSRVELPGRLALAWADRSLLPYLRGDKNEWLQKDPEILAAAKIQFLYPFYRRNQDLLDGELLNFFLQKLNDPYFRSDHFRPLEWLDRFALAELGPRYSVPERKVKEETWQGENILSRRYEEIVKYVGDRIFANPRVFAKAIDRSELIDARKQKLLTKGFLEGEFPNWQTHDEAPLIFDILNKYHVMASPSEFIEKFGKLRTGTWVIWDVYRMFSSRLIKELEEIKSLPIENRTKALHAFVTRLFFGLPESPSAPAGVVSLRNKIFEMFARCSTDRIEARFLFSMLARIARDEVSDRFFEKFVENTYEVPEKIMDNYGRTIRIDFLSKDYIWSPSIRLRVLKQMIFSHLNEVRKEVTTKENISKFLGSIQDAVPENSIEKDDFLEKLAWDLDLNDLPRLNELESQKAFGEKNNVSPFLVAKVSLLIEYIQALSPNQLAELIRYFLLPPGVADMRTEELFPKNVKETIRQLVIQDINRTGTVWKMLAKEMTREQAADRVIDGIKALARELKGFERIPAFKVLLHSGNHPIAKRPDFHEFVMKEFLKYNMDSTAVRWLTAYLKSVPDYAASTSLAYLLAKKSEGAPADFDIVEIFELHQTVGRKSGQQAHTFGLFESENGAELLKSEEILKLRRLKDHARPLSKAKIVQTLQSELPAKEFNKIANVVKVLGAASIKTVVLVKLKDGTSEVIAIQPEFAESQIRTNILYAQNFLRAAEQSGLIPEADRKFIHLLTTQSESQMFTELETNLERERQERASVALTDAAASLKENFGDWKVIVPAMSTNFSTTKRTLAMSVAHGVPLDEIADLTIRDEMGERLARLYMRAFFKNGWLDSDRHVGNQLIDVENKIVYVLDVPQSIDFEVTDNASIDDRVRLSEFVLAMIRAKPSDIVEAVINISDAQNVNKATRARIATKLEALLQNPPRSIRRAFTETLKTFIAEGVHPQSKFLIGLFKGVLTIVGEKYVSLPTFGKILSDEMTRFYTEAKPSLGFAQLLKGKVDVANTVWLKDVKCKGDLANLSKGSGVALKAR